MNFADIRATSFTDLYPADLGLQVYGHSLNTNTHVTGTFDSTLHEKLVFFSLKLTRLIETPVNTDNGHS